MLFTRLVLSKRFNVKGIIQLTSSSARLKSGITKWDIYKNTVDSKESLGELSKPWKMNKNDIAPSFDQDRGIIKGIKKKVFDPSKKKPQNSKNKRRKLLDLNEIQSDYNASVQMAIKVLSNGHGTGIKSFLLTSCDESYLFNPGEGTLRQLKNEQLKLKKVENILMTRANWRCTGGLSTITLELGYLNQNLTLHSPIDWKQHANQKLNRMFIDVGCQNVRQFHYDRQGQFEDKNLSVNLVKFKNTRLVNGNSQPTNSYEISFKKSTPKFLSENLEKYGLKAGPWIQQIKKGEAVTLEDGRVLDPKDFLDYSASVDRKMFVLDLSDVGYIDQLESVIDKNDESIQVITHLSNSKILNHPSYLDWIKSFPTNCIHLMFDEEHRALDSIKPYKLQAQLHLIDPQIFPLLDGQTTQYSLLKDEQVKKLKEMQTEMKIIQSESNMSLKLKPSLFLGMDKVVRPNNKEYMSEIFDYYDNDVRLQLDGGPDKLMTSKLDDLKEKIAKFDENIGNQNSQTILNQEIYPKILFLGTSSSSPTSFRNVTSILLNLNEDSSMMLDCGEATTNQLFKFFGQERTFRELVKIKLLFLTHIHLDHHGGVYGLIEQRINAFKRLDLPYEKLKIMVPKFYVEQWLYSIEQLFRMNIFDYVTFLPNEIFMTKNHVPKAYNKKLVGTKYLANEFSVAEQKAAIAEVKYELGLEAIEAVAVHHIGYSYGILLNIARSNAEPFKFVFSGDCRPNDCLVTLGRRCDLLVHECTFDNKMQQDAVKKNHSTIEEAVTIAKRMEARQTVLTHFSARYGILGHVDEINADCVGFSFDFLYINAENMKRTHQISDLLKTIFSPTIVENQKRQERLVLRNKLLLDE